MMRRETKTLLLLSAILMLLALAASCGSRNAEPPATAPTTPLPTAAPTTTESAQDLPPTAPPPQGEAVMAQLTFSVNDEMPEFTVELSFIFVAEDETYALQTLTIRESATGELVQTIAIPPLTYFGQTRISRYSYAESYGMAFEDLNFDGNLDIRQYCTPNGNHRVEWIYLVWNTETQQFENDARLNEIPLAIFEQETQLIHGMTRGWAAQHTYYTYRYIDGAPVMINQLDEEAIFLGDNAAEILALAGIDASPESLVIFHYIEGMRNEQTGEWSLIRDDYVFYLDSPAGFDEHTALARFNANSAVGQMLAEDS